MKKSSIQLLEDLKSIDFNHPDRGLLLEMGLAVSGSYPGIIPPKELATIKDAIHIYTAVCCDRYGMSKSTVIKLTRSHFGIPRLDKFNKKLIRHLQLYQAD